MPETVYFKQRGAASGRILFRYRDAGKWVMVSAERFNQDVGRAVTLLTRAGAVRGDRLMLVLPTSYPFVILDWAARVLGVVTVPVHPSAGDDEKKTILRETQPRLVISATGAAALEALALQAGLNVPVWSVDDPVMPRDRLLARLESVPSQAWMIQEEPDDLVTIVFTSGTTGQVKGVCVTAGMVAAMERGAIEALSVTADDRLYLFLPTAHIFGRLFLWVQARIGFEVALAPDYSRVQLDLREVAPTIVGVVPRLLEKMFEQVTLQMKARGGLGELGWHLAVKLAVARGRRDRVAFPLINLAGREVADRLMLRHVRQAFGGRLRYIISGGAPLSPDLASFYTGVGLPTLQGYGLTETTGVVFVTRPNDPAPQTVGLPLQGVEFKLASDSEILLRGAQVFSRYWNQTDAVRDSEGWFHTGDLGALDNQGRLRITGRSKDILITAHGKNIAPLKVERLLEAIPLVDKAVALGDNRPYLVALLSINPDELHRRFGNSISDPAHDDAVLTYLEREIERANKQLGSFESVKYFRVVPGTFSVQNGELTPTLKPRRAFIETKYAALVAEMYPHNQMAFSSEATAL